MRYFLFILLVAGLFCTGCADDDEPDTSEDTGTDPGEVEEEDPVDPDEVDEEVEPEVCPPEGFPDNGSIVYC